jgi:hypothetical protein
MMTFDNEPLFGSGVARFKIGPVKLRNAIQHAPGSLGVRLDRQGTEARRINQAGVLISDTTEELRAQVDAIEIKIDGLAHTLVDNIGRVWNNAVLLEFDTDSFERVGARWKTAYRVEYLQVIP